MQIRLIKNGQSIEVTRLIKDIDDFQLSLIKPKNFDSSDPENVIKSIEIAFENVCTTLEELGVASPSTLSVFSFYSKIAYFEKKNAPK